MQFSFDTDQTAIMQYSDPDLHYLLRYFARYQYIPAHGKKDPSSISNNPAEVVYTGEQQKIFLKWPYDCIIFHASVFVK